MTNIFASRAKVMTVINTFLIVMALLSLGCESWKHNNDKSQRVKTGAIRGRQTKVNHNRGCKHANQPKRVHPRIIWRVPR